MKETLFAISFGMGMGIGLGAMMGYQLHEQTTPAAVVANIALSNRAKITQIEARLEKYLPPIVIRPSK